MNPKIYLLLFLSLFGISKIQSQSCSSSFIFSYTGISNFVWFQDHSTASASWQRDYTHWNFNDGSAIDTAKTATHTFPQAQIYNVVKETRFSEIGNPTNICIAKDSLLINAAQSTSTNVCIPHVAMKVKWLTGLTYGVSNYVSAGCTYNYREIVADTGSVFMGTPMNGLYTTNQYYFTYTVSLPQYNNNITHHINYPDPHNSSGTEDYYYTVNLNLNHQTPTDCHASFFLSPRDSTSHNWTIQDFSSSSDSLSYLWDFGDGNTSTLTSPTHTYSSIGMYTICLTVSSGTCSDIYCETAFIDTTINGQGINSLNVQKMIVTNLSDIKKEESLIKLFPNPAKNDLTISYPFKKEDCFITILNLLGEQVFYQKVESSSANTINLNIEELNNGIYFLKINSGNGEALAKTKFIKQ